MYEGQYHDFMCGADESLPQIMNYNPILLSASFVRREALLAVGLFDERIEFEEDWDLWLRLHERFGPSTFWRPKTLFAIIGLFPPSARRRFAAQPSMASQSGNTSDAATGLIPFERPTASS